MYSVVCLLGCVVVCAPVCCYVLCPCVCCVWSCVRLVVVSVLGVVGWSGFLIVCVFDWLRVCLPVPLSHCLFGVFLFVCLLCSCVFGSVVVCALGCLLCGLCVCVFVWSFGRSSVASMRCLFVRVVCVCVVVGLFVWLYVGLCVWVLAFEFVCSCVR